MPSGTDPSSSTPAAADSAADAVGLPAKRRRSRGLWIASGIALVAMLALLGVALILFLGIEGNPLVARLVRERIVLALQERIDPSLRLSIGSVDLKRQEAGTAVRVTAFTVKGPDGRTLISAPSGLVVLDTPSLFIFRLIPTEVVLDGLQVAVEISETGEFTVATGEGVAKVGAAPAVDAPPVERLQQFIGAAFAGLAATRDAVGGSLPTLGIGNAQLAIDDRRTGRRVTVRDISGRLISAPDGGAQARMTLKTGSTPFAVSLTLSPRSDKGQVFTARSERLTLGDVLAAAGLPVRDIDASSVVDLGITAQVDRDLKARTAEADLVIKGTEVRFSDGKTDPIALQDMQLKLLWQDGADTIAITRLQAASGETKVALTGSAAPPGQPQDPWVITLAGKNLPIDSLGKTDPDFELTDVSGVLHAWPDASRLAIARFEAVSPKARVQLSGQVAAESDGRPSFSLDLEAGESDARVALRLWPAFAAPEVRTWLVGHLKHGWVNQLKLKLAFSADAVETLSNDKPLPEDAVSASWHVSRAVLAALPGAPAIRDATASGTATGRAVRVDVTGGAIDVGQGRRIAVPEGSFTVTDTSRKPADARVRLRFTGAAEAVAELIRAPGIQQYTSVSIDPASLKGSVEGEADIGLRLAEKMGPKDVRVGVNASIKGLTIDKAIGGEKIEAGAFQLSVDRDQVLLKGDAKVFGAPAAIEVRASGKAKPRATLALVLDEATRARKGYGLGGAISGPISLKVATDLDAPDDRDMQIDADLSKARIDGVIPGWTKAAGQAGRAKAMLSTTNSGGWQLEDIELDSGTLSVRGTAQLGADGQFIKASLPTFKVSTGDSARLDAERAGGVLKLTVKGNSIDARPFLRSLQTGTIEKSGGKDIEVALRSTVLSGFNGEVVADANLNLGVRGGEMKRFDLSGGFDRGPVTTRLVTRQGGQPTLTVSSEDAGAFLRFFDIYNRMQGGHLTLGATLGSGNQAGTLLVKDFVLRNEPAMKRLVADNAAQSAGDVGRIDPALVKRLTANQDVRFSKMTVEFARNAGRLDIKDAVIWGPEVGGSIAGYLDYARDKVDLTGTFVPAYSLNNFFAQVPVLGPLLGGGRNEGLFAVRYSIIGKVSAPTLTVNPLTAIAPGFLRKLIDIRGASGPPGAPTPPMPITTPR